MKRLMKRILNIYRKEGAVKVFKKAFVKAYQNILYRKIIVFYVSLADDDIKDYQLPRELTVKRRCSEGELLSEEMEQLSSHWNSYGVFNENIARFKKGSSAWLLEEKEKVLAFQWTVRGKTIKPYLFPFTKDDAHIFDCYVFPEYRGKKLNSMLTNYLLRELRKEGVLRVFWEVHEWNRSELKSVPKIDIAYREVGTAKKYRIFNKELILWEGI
jgi:GNAT superfamily N-acetyltransferase